MQETWRKGQAASQTPLAGESHPCISQVTDVWLKKINPSHAG